MENAEEKETRRDPLDEILDEEGKAIEPVEVAEFARCVQSINDYPPYVPEDENDDILIKGRWLERGGSAWWISTAGTGKSIVSVQAAYRWGYGLEFAGLTPMRPLRSWIIQSEDSPSRITIDREDIVAELREQTPEVDWAAVGREAVQFVKVVGKVGVEFIEEMERLLSLATKLGKKPDIIIINPFMAFVGGPVSDGGYVTPFLRGGEIGKYHTDGLQALLERNGVGALIFHHTPKPPTDKELDAWMNSTFPEYQGAGSSDITNWGRSFVTMMRLKENHSVVCLCAGKNGSEIGWESIGGSKRHYMAWSNGVSITGGNRHAWRELDEDEYEKYVVSKKVSAELDLEGVATEIAEGLKKKALMWKEIYGEFIGRFRKRDIEEAKKLIHARPEKYHVTIVRRVIRNKWTEFVGLADGARAAADLAEQKAKAAKQIEEAKKESEKQAHGCACTQKDDEKSEEKTNEAEKPITHSGDKTEKTDYGEYDIPF